MAEPRQLHVNEPSLLETAGFAGSMFILGSAFLSLSPLLPVISLDFGTSIAASTVIYLGWRVTLMIWAVAWIAVVLAIRGQLSGLRPTSPGSTNLPPPTKKTFSGSARTLRDLSRHIALFVATLLIFIGFYGEYTFLGTAVAHFGTTGMPVMSVLVSMYGGGFLFGAMNASKIDRFTPLRTLCNVTPALAAVLFVLPFLAGTLPAMAGIMFFWGALQALTFTSLTAIAAASPSHMRGRVIAYNSACVMGGASIGSTIGGPVFEQFSYQAVGVLCSLTTIAAALVLYFGLRRTHGNSVMVS